MRVVPDIRILLYWVSQPERLTPPQQHAIKTISPKGPAVLAEIPLWRQDSYVDVPTTPPVVGARTEEPDLGFGVNPVNRGLYYYLLVSITESHFVIVTPRSPRCRKSNGHVPRLRRRRNQVLLNIEYCS